MRTFKEYFEDMETRVDRIALLPGGFKPPTKGHFNALRYLLDDADRGVVFIGGKEREGITPEQSEQIWNIYTKYVDKPVEVVYVPNPVRAVYDFADNNLDKTLLVGAGEKDEDMETRVDRIALLPGGFKPPTKGHFNALRYLLDDADRGVVFIGGKEREGIKFN